MRNKPKIIFVLLLCLLPMLSFGQKGVTTFGVQYKPIIPNPMIGTYKQDFNIDHFESSVTQKIGHHFGMVIRRGITDIISIETGIAFTQRNFGLSFAVPDSNLAATDNVGFIGYEIPISGLIYTRLGDNFFMNTSLGASFNYFPSDVRVEVPIAVNEYFLQEGARLNRIQGAMLANIGFEYRTKKNGYFYLGGSYNLPFASIVTFAMSYEYPPGNTVVLDNIRGSYLTLDLRYYFNEKPDKDRKR